MKTQKTPKNPAKLDYKSTIKLIKPFKLKPREEIFVACYLENGCNGTEAYIQAGYNPGNKNVAGVQATQLLRRPSIQAAMGAYLEAILGPIKTDTQKHIIDSLMAQAFYDPSIFVNPDGTVKFSEWSEIPEPYRHCVEGIEKKFYGKDCQEEVVIIKLVDRKAAQAQLARYIQMIKDVPAVQVVPMNKEVGDRLANIFESGIKGGKGNG